MPPHKFKIPIKTRFVSQIILFQETLEFKHTIALCYGRQQSLALQGHVPTPQVWAIAQIVANTLGLVVQQCVLNQSQGYWLLLDAFVVAISFVCQMRTYCLTPNSIETQNFDGELQVFQQHVQKHVIQVLEPFLSFMLCFQSCKAHNMLTMMLDPHYKGLGLVIQNVGKERALQIANEYDRAILFPLFVCAYKFLKPTNVSERVSNFASESSQSTSFYDFMEIDEDMALLVVNEQFTHFKIKKGIEEECKDPLAWWRAHEVHYSYVGFVARQILGIVGSQIEVERVFNIASICTNLRHSRLGIDNLEMFISIYFGPMMSVLVGLHPWRNS